MKYASKQRREWLTWHHEHGENISATCQESGISRGTFYRWLERYQPDKPSKPLRDRSRKPRTKRKRTWTDLDIEIVAELTMIHPRLGAGRMAEVTQGYGLPYSRATIGRMLARIMRRCPICRGRGGMHKEYLHILNQVMLRRGIPWK